MSAETNSKQVGMSVLETIPELPVNSGGASSPRVQLPTMQAAAASSGGDGTVKTTTSTTTTMTTSASHSSVSDSFNTEDFLARVNKNDKICNILRTPGGGVRQRSVYTAINSSTRFNVAATPFISQMPMSATSVGHGMSSGSSLCNGAGNQMIMGMSVKDACMSNGGHMMHMVPPSPHHHFGPGGYETPMTSRSSGINNRPVPYSGRYMSPQQQSQMYFENDITRLYPQPMPPPPFAVNRVNSQRDSTYDKTPPPCPGAGPLAMANGTIQLRLRDGIRIDMTLDRSVRVLNQRSMVAMSLSRNCANAALIHPNGRILQSGSKIEIVTYDGMKTNNFVRYAKMWYKGVSFTSESCALIYLVDTAGTRTTTDTFTDLTKDYTLSVFYDDARHGPSFFKEAYDVVKAIEYTCTEDGTDVYDINGFRITQAADGLVKVTRNNNKCLIRTSPGNGSATLTTPGIHCTASLGKTSHLFVRRNEKRMHFDGSSFIVRNAGHSAGFNESNLLIVY